MGLQVTSLDPIPAAPVNTRWRRIVSMIPVPESVPLIRRLREVEPQSMAGMPPLVWHEAEGFLVRDPFGNQWIDLTSGIVLANAGHAHPRIVQAIRTAADRRLLATYAFPSESRLKLLDRLVSLSPIADSKAALFSSGTEATECAIMLMRRHGQRIHSDKVGILSLSGNYHGRTLAAQLASGTPQTTDWIDRGHVRHFQLPAPNCLDCPWGRRHYERCGEECFHAGLEGLAAQGIDLNHIAGLILEPVPGWSTSPIPTDFATAASRWARQHECLLAFDEIQCGCGRTGNFFGGECLGVNPDVIILGKGLSSSLPVSAVIGPRELMDLPLPGEMSSTHGGNPVCAAAALANLQILEDEKLIDAAVETGTAVLERLTTLQTEFPDRVRSVQGVGLFLSIHIRQPGTNIPDVMLADAVAQEAVRRGVLMFTTGRGYLKVTPPLCIDIDAALEAADVIRESLYELCAASP